MELYESMEEGKNHTVEQQRAILKNIKEQALYNYQNGLHDEIKLIVRSQRYQTIQEAIAGAIAEEKTRGPSTRTLTYRNRPVFKAHTPSSRRKKCGKIGHYGRDCRTSRFSNRYTLPKLEGQPRINTIEKQCSYCKKIGHLRYECWTLNGKSENSKNSGKIFSNLRREMRNFKNKKIETGEDKPTVPRPASEYRVAHIKGISLVNTGLNAFTLPIAEAKGRKINFLFDTGASATIIKLKHALDHVLIYEEKTKLRHNRT
ncbi:hypothetical protein P5V15_012873 [Pogonomyrmex californicus]